MFYKIVFFATIFSIYFAYSKDMHSNKVNQKDTVLFVVPSLTITSDKADFQKSPVPFSQITEAELDKNYIYQDIANLISETPSAYSYSQNGNGIGYSTLSIRGFDQRRISVNINGIPQNDPEDHNVYWIDFPDLASNLESIQVQRGSGLTNFGSASIGASINLTTSNFINKQGVKLYSGIGYQQFGSNDDKFQQNISKFSIEASSGLINQNVDDKTKYAIYSRLSRINSFGYRNNSYAYLNSYFLGFATFTNNISTQFNLFGGPINDALAYNGIPKSYIYDKNKRILNYNYWSYDSTGKNVDYYQIRRNQEIEEFSQPHFELLNEIKLDKNLLLNSALFYYSGEGYFDYDGTGWTDANSFALNNENGYPNAEDPRNPIIRAYVNNKQIGYIPRLKFINENYTFNIGLELRFHNSIHWGKINFAENLPENYNPDFEFYHYEGHRNIYSIFSNFNYLFNDNLALLIEGQLVYNNYSIDNERRGNIYTTYRTIDGKIIGNGGDLFNINYLFFNPKIGLNYNFNDLMSLFGYFAITSKEPRMANIYNASESFSGNTPNFNKVLDENGNTLYDFSKPKVVPETLYDFEIGWNYKSITSKYSVNVYFMYYKDELVKSGQLDMFGDPIDGNAPLTIHSGIELAASQEIFNSSTSQFNLSGNISYSKNRIINYDFPLSENNSVSLKNNPVAGFPDILANIRASINYYTFYASLSYQYIGSYKTDNFGNLLSSKEIKDYLGYNYYVDNTLDAYGIFNLDLSYKWNLNQINLKSLEFQIKMNNLLNKIYAAGAEGKEFFPGAERNVFFGINIEF